MRHVSDISRGKLLYLPKRGASRRPERLQKIEQEGEMSSAHDVSTSVPDASHDVIEYWSGGYNSSPLLLIAFEDKFGVPED